MNRGYQPLAHRYRPRNFAELIGQDSVRLALQGSLRLGRVISSVIFAGIRGTGKTTIARILAKALNCERREGGDPCGKCSVCVAVAKGTHEDVLEIDGASNTGVDDIRELQESLAYVPQRSEYKVYIIDEVHMLSINAFNALLKTLEEPRAKVVFIFATTELAKIPRTVRSRCQVFNLTRLTATSICNHVKHLLTKENIPYEDRALELLASYSEGSMRDALTMVDQAILLGDGSVKYENIESSTNLAPTQIAELLKALVARDARHLIETLETIDVGGVELRKVCEQLAGYARHAFIIKDLGSHRSLGQPEEIVDSLQTVARDSAPFDLNRIFRTLVKCSKELDGSALDRYVFENYCLEWCFDPGLPSQKPVTDRKLPAIEKPKVVAAEPPPQKSTSRPRIAVDDRFPRTWRELVDDWKRVYPFHGRQLEEAKLVTYRPDLIELAIADTSFAARSLLRKGESEKLRLKFVDMFGFAGRIIVCEEEERHSSKLSLLEVEKNLEPKEIGDAKKHPLTREIVKKFDAEITDANLEDT